MTELKNREKRSYVCIDADGKRYLVYETWKISQPPKCIGFAVKPGARLRKGVFAKKEREREN